jgi:hypothetical protein
LESQKVKRWQFEEVRSEKLLRTKETHEPTDSRAFYETQQNK